MFEARHITLALGAVRILHGVNLRARPGEITAIVGPNGSGKTTLLKALTGECPYEGEVLLDGQDITALSPAELAGRRAVLPQSSRLSFPFTVREVVRMGLFSGIEAGREDLPEKALERVGLSGFAARYYHELSGGERQRTQLARVLVQVWHPAREGRANWLFLDEPVSALDIGHQLEVMQVAEEFVSGGGGVIAIMHDLNLTAMFAQHVLLLKAGRELASGTPGKVLRNETLSAAYGCRLRINTPPSGPRPWLLPQAVERSETSP